LTGSRVSKTRGKGERREKERRTESPKDVPEKKVGVLINGRRRVTTVELEEEQYSDTDDLLVEEVDDHVRVAHVGPVAVNEQQPLEEAELAHCVVGGVDGLKTFFTGDSDSDVCGLDHRDVVGAVADGEAHRTESFLDEANDEGFLKGRGTATDDGAAASGEFEEDLLGKRLLKGVAKGRTVNDETVASRTLTVVVADDVGNARDAGGGTVELEGAAEAARSAVGARAAVFCVGRLVFELGGESFSVEETLESTSKLSVGGVGLAVLASLDDDEVHVAREEVASLGDGDSGLKLVPCSDPNLEERGRKRQHPLEEGGKAKKGRRTLIPALFKSAIASGTPSWSLSSIAVAPRRIKSRSRRSATASIPSSRPSMRIVASWKSRSQSSYCSSSRGL
jgi:hypothetical protein